MEHTMGPLAGLFIARRPRRRPSRTTRSGEPCCRRAGGGCLWWRPRKDRHRTRLYSGARRRARSRSRGVRTQELRPAGGRSSLAAPIRRPFHCTIEAVPVADPQLTYSLRVGHLAPDVGANGSTERKAAFLLEYCLTSHPQIFHPREHTQRRRTTHHPRYSVFRSTENRLWDIRVPVRPCRSEGPHVEQVAARESRHLGELSPQVLGQPANDPAAPALVFLPGQNVSPDPPVEPEQVRVDPTQSLQPGTSDARLQFPQEGWIVIGQGELRGFGHGPHPIEEGQSLTVGLPRKATVI